MTKQQLPELPEPVLRALDQWLSESGPQTLTDIGKMGVQFKKRLFEAAYKGEMSDLLSGEGGVGNSRNGYSSKTVHGDGEEIELSVPRDRRGRYEPQIIPKHSRRLPEFDGILIELYAKGMSIRDIQSYVERMYGIKVSASLISHVTDAINDDVDEWRTRPLDSSYPIVFFDAIRVKVRDSEGRQVGNQALHVALAIDNSGRKQLLGLWFFPNESAKTWLGPLNDLKSRGVRDILYASVDALSGFAEAIESVFKDTTVQTCIVHLLRNSLRYVSYQDRKKVAEQLKGIYRAPNEQAARQCLERFEGSPLGSKYPMIGKSWRRHWEHIIPFFAFAPEVRRLLYTTNAIESVNSVVRKATRNRGHFPSTEAALKSIFMLLQNLTEKWTLPVHGWASARIQLAIQYGDRFEVAD